MFPKLGRSVGSGPGTPGLRQLATRPSMPQQASFGPLKSVGNTGIMPQQMPQEAQAEAPQPQQQMPQFQAPEVQQIINRPYPMPMPIGGGNMAPMQAQQKPGPTLFEFGNPVAANPDLARRHPAFEGLMSFFKGRKVY